MKKTLIMSIILITFLLGVFSLYGHGGASTEGIWVSRSGSARDMDMGRDNSTLWIVSNSRASGGSGYKVKQRVGMNWVTRSNGLSEGAFRISVGSDGRPWVITGNRTIKRWSFSQNKFKSISSNRTANDLTIYDNDGNNELYICSTESANDGIGFKIYKYQGGNNWYLYSHNLGGHRIAVNYNGDPAIVRYTNQGSSYEKGDLYLWDGSQFRIASPVGFKVHEIDNTSWSTYLLIAATDDPDENDSHIFIMMKDYLFDRDRDNFPEYKHAPSGSKYDSFTFDFLQGFPGWCTIIGNSTYEYLKILDSLSGYASSAYNSNYIGDKALDNDPYTKWNTAYGCAPPHYLIIDMWTYYPGMEIGAVEILHAGWREYDKYNTKDYKIQTSNDLVNWTTRVTVTDNTQDKTLHIFPSLVEAEYIKLYITHPGEYYARIYSVVVYGYSGLDGSF